ncbi:endochitinase 1 [Nannizzia gypsea CBS 118893]|uniref:chitinase n=1 Tax=Arthroderma gypseum (strain ATCC MYA-4604 / CBS 118893) TaxID=535722 RepID=E4UZI5_ARTGP|nr:endochitinase 1 [Nannizzia gypsea CBS 118893]EFR03515.1 endochitinase 1 [Nannizzia gypsea CBS 118893]
MRFSSALALGLACLANIGDVFARPTPDSRPPPSGGYKTVGYYGDWDVYKRNFHPKDLVGDQWTHILYSFAAISPEGEVSFKDTSNTQKIYEGDNQSLQGNNLFGSLKQMYLMKQKNRQMKTLISIGGWTYKDAFSGPASTDTGRQTFAKSSVKMLADYGFDGIDIDWEYPTNEKEAGDFVLLLAEVRKALDEYSKSIGDGYKYLLTVASPAGASHYNIMKLGEMDKHLDFWNLMAYDYSGKWDQTSGHSANIFSSTTDKTSTKFNTQDALLAYYAAGIKPEKIVLGMPLYGRSFTGTENKPGASFSGVGEGSFEDGVWNYKDLPQPGATVVECEQEVASYSYDPAKKLFISYDTPKIAGMKANYLRQMGLGGTMWWEASGDKPKGEGSLVETVIERLGGRETMDKSENQLSYPQSQYDNIKNQMKM